MLALSTPVVDVWAGILVFPLVGTLDTARARQLTQALLRAVREHQARVVIADTLATVDIRLGEVETYASLRQGLAASITYLREPF